MVEKPVYLVSPLLERFGFRHAFFTRLGGVSLAPFDSLNFSITVGDRVHHVRENLARAASCLGVAEDNVYFLSQVHGTKSFVVDSTHDAVSVRTLQGDVVVSRDPHAACAVRVADCVPILMADAASGVTAAVHSGWRGAVQRVAASAMSALSTIVRGTPHWVCAIGPHIEACCFEVGDDVASDLLSVSPDPDIIVRSAGARPRANLRRLIRAQLRSLGIAEECIDDVPGCTMCDPTRFFSHRRDGARSGRHLCAIVPMLSG